MEKKIPETLPENGNNRTESVPENSNVIPGTMPPGIPPQFIPGGNKAPVVPKIKKPPLTLQKGDTVFAVIFMVLSILGVSSGLWGGFRLFYAVVYTLFLLTFSLCLYKRDVKLNAFSIVCGVLAFLGSSVYISTSNVSVKLWMFVCQFVLSSVWIDSLRGVREEKGDLGFLRNLLVSTFPVSIENAGPAVEAIFTEKDGRRKRIGKVLLGMACAIPVLFVVIPLLISSDSAFEGFVNRVIDNIASAFFRVIIGVGISVFIIGYCFGHKYGERPEPKDSAFKGIDAAYTVSFLSVIALCYLAYLFSQLAYFFSGFMGILPSDYTFNVSTYARRGFFELGAIAGINLLIIFLVLLISKKNNSRLGVANAVLCFFIGLFTLVITATALSKMVLYIKSFGMTVLRLTTSAFMLFIGTVFIALIIRCCFTPKVNVLRTAAVSAGCILIILGVGNVNRVVAEYNIFAYKVGLLNTVDVETIYELGDEGVPYLIELYGYKDIEISGEARQRIECCIDQYYNTYYEPEGYRRVLVGEREYNTLEEWSFARSRAYDLLDDYIENDTVYHFKE